MRTAVVLACLSVTFWSQPSSRTPPFTAASPVRVGPGSGTVILADVNGDGRLDMLTRHLQSRIVMVASGNGTGGFDTTSAGTIAFSYAPGDIKLGDVNKDGHLDLVVTASDRDIADVRLGDGKGAFSPIPGSPFTVTTSIDQFNKRTLHLVDLNEDGNLDIVTANGRRRNTFASRLGNGRGAFSTGPVVALDADRDAYWFAFGDLDGDGHLDVVTTSTVGMSDEGPGRLLVQSGDGRGGFKAVSWSPEQLPSGAGPVTLADINGDRRIDLAIAQANGLLAIWLNEGHGRLARSSAVNLGTRSYAVRVMDVNDDRTPDLVAATVNSITVLLRGSRGYTPAPGSPFAAGPGAYNLGVGDVNADGKLDVAATSFDGDTVTLLLGR